MPMYDVQDPSDVPPPDAAINLASAVHPFRAPEMASADKLSFFRAFKTCSGGYEKTVAALKKADAYRSTLAMTLVGSRRSTIAHEAIISAAKNYLPLIHQILLTCKVQPEIARLDEKLFFDWSSGIEVNPTSSKSEALMYEFVMTLASVALGTSGLACDECKEQDFAAAGRHFKEASGIMKYLAEELLPKWISHDDCSEHKGMPVETSIETCDAFEMLFLATGQQMAVSMVLTKPGSPNYSLLSKLALGIAEQLEKFLGFLKSKAGLQMSKMDPNFIGLINFQIKFQRSLSLYFLARTHWDAKSYGVAIAMLKETVLAIQMRKTPAGKGLPTFDAKSSYKYLEDEVRAFHEHIAALLCAWEKDNSTIYYDTVPRAVPVEHRLKEGLSMTKPEPFVMDMPDPLPLFMPGARAY